MVRNGVPKLLVHILDIVEIVHVVHEPAQLLRNFALGLVNIVDDLNKILANSLHLLAMVRQFLH
jgi:hypothetical protein